jgi:hypothetical protein
MQDGFNAIANRGTGMDQKFRAATLWLALIIIVGLALFVMAQPIIWLLYGERLPSRGRDVTVFEERWIPPSATVRWRFHDYQ